MVRGEAGELGAEALAAFPGPESFEGLFPAQGISPSDEIILKRTVTVLPAGRSLVWLNCCLLTAARLPQWREEL
ncbi:MAG: hypothetical protein LBQ12_07545 [Deltaproteobacteria bacterium]|jgi:DNA repair ATPase RecN|nr:hypothetical protein [Deltaproteobacteria bacterium]